MNSEDRQTYNLLYLDYLYSLLFESNNYELPILERFHRENEEIIAELAGIINDTIQNVVIDKRIKLRADAKFFLLTNFHQMIIRPLLMRESNAKNLDLNEAVRQDVKSILIEANRDSGQEEINVHKIMTAIDNLWEELESTRSEIWEYNGR